MQAPAVTDSFIAAMDSMKDWHDIFEGPPLSLTSTNHHASNQSFLMEVAERTPSDRKGGHLAQSNGRFLLRELAKREGSLRVEKHEHQISETFQPVDSCHGRQSRPRR